MIIGNIRMLTGEAAARSVAASCITALLFILIVHPDTSESGDIRGDVLLRQARLSERVLGLPGLTNVGRVAPGIFRGAQPTSEGFKTLREMGIRTIINLRNRHSEKQVVENLGMKSIEIPFDIFSSPEPVKVDQVIALMSDPKNQPLFVHCAHGQDRTGVIVAVYRLKVDGWNLAEAEEEMQAFGFNDIWIHLKNYVRTYPDNNK